MQTASIKTSAHELIDQLPESVSWSELAYHIEVRASIERGIEDADAGRTYTTDEVKKRLGLTQ
jgi:predicted transcriptional regulator